MKTFKSILVVLFLVMSLSAGQKESQRQKSDSESVGLKGRVRTVVDERAPLTKNGDQWKEGERAKKSIENYDVHGNLTQTEDYIGGVLHSKKTFFNLDGERAIKSESFGRGGSGAGPGNKGQPDPRFSFKYQYKYDKQGNREEIKLINTYGREIIRTINKHDAQGNLVESKETEYFYNTKPPERTEIISYKLDAKGEAISTTRPGYSIDYADYKYDETGNWISRKVKMVYTFGGNTTTTVYIEYRTITYFEATAN